MATIAQFFIGIDLHKSVVQVCVLDGRGRLKEERRVRLEVTGSREQLLDDLEGWGPGAHLAVEALGLNRWLVDGCLERGLEVVVVDPIKLGLKTLGKKTDRRDAHEIARRLYLGDLKRHAATYYPTEREYGVRKVIRGHHKLKGMRQQVVNQLRSLLNAYGVASPRGVLYTAKNLVWLREYRWGQAELGAFVQAMVGVLEATQRSVEDLRDWIREVAEEPEVAELQEQLPSVGPQTAATLIYELGDVNRFRDARAVASYAGLVPRVSQSADRSHHGRLTKRGSGELRWILGQWAVRLLARDLWVRRWAAPLLRRRHRNQVRTALARRLLVGVYIARTRGIPFSLEACLARD
jgi:transposase